MRGVFSGGVAERQPAISPGLRVACGARGLLEVKIGYSVIQRINIAVRTPPAASSMEVWKPREVRVLFALGEKSFMRVKSL
jgi:hypothetical protein